MSENNKEIWCLEHVEKLTLPIVGYPLQSGNHNMWCIAAVGSRVEAPEEHKECGVITNDSRACRAAEEPRIPLMGSLGILEHAVEVGRLKAEEAGGIPEPMIQAGELFSEERVKIFRPSPSASRLPAEAIGRRPSPRRCRWPEPARRSRLRCRPAPRQSGR